MELNEKLQELRKRKGLTQEEVAEALYVSRTAVSKWESGRGYPSIESLKALSKFFSISIDELLSGEELLVIAEEETRLKEKRLADLVCGLLHCSMAMLLFLPFFGQRYGAGMQAVSLLTLMEIGVYLKVFYWVAVTGMTVWGVLLLALQNWEHRLWVRHKNKVSLLAHALAVILFIVGRQPYAAVYVFVSLMIQVWMRVKKG